MTVPRHRLIEQRRQQFGISASELARRIGISIHEYRDVESYDDELTMVLPLKNVRTLAAILGFDIGVLLGEAGSPVVEKNMYDKPRHIILTEARHALGVSTQKMATDIDFEETFVRRIEDDSDALENYPYEVLKIVAGYLKLAPQELLFS